MARYFTKIEIIRKQPSTDDGEKRILAPLSRGDSIIYHKETKSLTYVVATAKEVVWDFSVLLCSMVSKFDDTGKESFVPGTQPLCYTIPTTVERVRSYLVLTVSGHVGGLSEEDCGETVVWTI